MKKLILSMGIIIILGIVFTLMVSGRGCPKRGSDRKVGSSGIPEWSLPAPSNLTATAVSVSRIDLSWQDNSLGEDGFELERSTNGITYTLLATVGANITFYSDTGPFTLFATYYYRVRGYNTIGDRSAWSNVVSATALQPVWSAVAAGGFHTLVLSSNGTAWAWGANAAGQLGLGDNDVRTTPTLIESDFEYNVFEDIDSVAAGLFHIIARKTNGTIWAWGKNDYGQLGLGDTESANVPFNVGTDSDWLVVSGTNLSAVATGSFHNIGRKTSGTLWAWGWNYYGQLGLGDTIQRNTPTQIGTGSDWSAIAVGGCYAIAIKTNSILWSWGRNNHGQLGLGDLDINRNTPTQIGTDSDWSTVTAGSGHTFAIKTNDTLWTWGSNSHGQLSLGDTINRLFPTQIETNSDWSVIAGSAHTIGVKANGTIWGWGWNLFGQLGLGDNINRNTPSQIGTGSDWAQVTAGSKHTLGLKTNNTLWAWGYNEYGQLGLGDTINRYAPTLVGE